VRNNISGLTLANLQREMSEVKEFAQIRLKDYETIVGEVEINRVRELAEEVRGRSVTHVNATAFGGGVAEMLHRMIPLLRDVGVDAHWKVIEGSKEFFTVTKTMHNALQGKPVKLTDDMKQLYLKYNELNAKLLSLDDDFVIIHDPQPAAIINFYPKRRGSWVWRCHIDLSTPNPIYWNFISNFINQYDAAIFTLEEFVKPDIKVKRIKIIRPSIDPLSDKNKPLSSSQILKVLDKYGVDPDRPIITQVSRFDPWKDPLGVIDVFRRVKEKVPDAQLLMVGSMATDDPEGPIYYERTVEYARGDKDIHFLLNLSDIEVNAIQRASNVILQKSVREGFSLTTTEALWKGVPVVASKVGGIPLQVIDGVTGFLAESVDDFAEKVVYLLENPRVAEELGKNGREHVRRNFLMTRHLADYLELFRELS